MSVPFDNYRYPINKNNVLDHSNPGAVYIQHQNVLITLNAYGDRPSVGNVTHDNCQHFLREFWIRYRHQTPFWKMADEIMHIVAVLRLLDIFWGHLTIKIPSYHLTHWGRVTHICVGKLTSIASDNGLSPGRRQAIIWNIAGIVLIGPLGTNFSEILIEIQTFSFKKMHLKMSSARWRPFVSASLC